MEVWHYAFAFPSLEYEDNALHRDKLLDLLFGRKEAFVVPTLEHCLHIFGPLLLWKSHLCLYIELSGICERHIIFRDAI